MNNVFIASGNGYIALTPEECAHIYKTGQRFHERISESAKPALTGVAALMAVKMPTTDVNGQVVPPYSRTWSLYEEPAKALMQAIRNDPARFFPVEEFPASFVMIKKLEEQKKRIDKLEKENADAMKTAKSYVVNEIESLTNTLNALDNEVGCLRGENIKLKKENAEWNHSSGTGMAFYIDSLKQSLEIAQSNLAEAIMRAERAELARTQNETAMQDRLLQSQRISDHNHDMWKRECCDSAMYKGASEAWQAEHDKLKNKLTFKMPSRFSPCITSERNPTMQSYWAGDWVKVDDVKETVLNMGCTVYEAR